MISFLPIDHWSAAPDDVGADPTAFLCQRFGSEACQFFSLGRIALDRLLFHLRLCRDDELWIVTTFDLPNVSSCVTCTVFNHCRPSRLLTEKTKAILVIHEFGVPHPDLLELAALAKSRGIPLIEDCAHTVDSWRDQCLVGTVGNWTILSFPKVFPVTNGGVLLGPVIDYASTSTETHNIRTIQESVAPHLPQIAEYSKRRRAAFRELTRIAERHRLQPLFEVTDAIAPWFFPIRTSHWAESLNRAAAASIDCAHWHGSDLIVLPCHQFLGQREFQVIDEFLGSLASSHGTGHRVTSWTVS